MWRHIDVQADWRRSWTYGRAPNAIDISQGSLTCPSKHRHGTTLFIRWFRHTAPFSRLLRSRWGYGGHILDLTPPGPHGGMVPNTSILWYICILYHGPRYPMVRTSIYYPALNIPWYILYKSSITVPNIPWYVFRNDCNNVLIYGGLPRQMAIQRMI